MQEITISIVYDGAEVYTKQIAKTLADNLQSDLSSVHLIEVDSVKDKLHLLHQSNTIVFGCPTYFGDVSANFKQFMETTGGFWYSQLWKDKLAAAFTVSPTRSGDKLNTLISLALFAAQHSMLWISQGIMPRYCNDEQTDGQNRFASYLGLMVQSDTAKELNPLHPADILTTELFAKRVLEITQKFRNIENYYYETSTN